MSEENQTPPVEPVVPAEPVVTIDPKAYEEMKADMHKFKQQSQLDKAALDESNAKLKLNEEAEINASADAAKQATFWKERAESSEAKELSTREAYLEDKRFSAIEKEAAIQGMDAKGLQLLKSGAFDTSSVITETTSEGRVNILGAKERIETLKAEWGVLFPTTNAPNLNTRTPNTPNLQDQTLSGKQILDLQRKDPAAYKSYMAKKLG